MSRHSPLSPVGQKDADFYLACAVLKGLPLEERLATDGALRDEGTSFEGDLLGRFSSARLTSPCVRIPSIFIIWGGRVCVVVVGGGRGAWEILHMSTLRDIARHVVVFCDTRGEKEDAESFTGRLFSRWKTQPGTDPLQNGKRIVCTSCRDYNLYSECVHAYAVWRLQNMEAIVRPKKGRGRPPKKAPDAKKWKNIKLSQLKKKRREHQKVKG